MAEPVTVPDEIFLAYSDAESACWGHPDHGIRYAACCRRAGLAAAIPLIQQQTRAAIAAELEAHAEDIGWYEGGGVWAEALGVIQRGGDRG